MCVSAPRRHEADFSALTRGSNSVASDAARHSWLRAARQKVHACIHTRCCMTTGTFLAPSHSHRDPKEEQGEVDERNRSYMSWNATCGVLLSRPGSSLRASFFIHVVEDLQSHVMACNVVPFVVVSWIMSFRVTLHLCGGRSFSW